MPCDGGLVAKTCPTLATPWTVAGQAPLSMEFSRQEYWGGLPFPSPGDLPDPEIELGCPALQVYSLPSEPPGKSCLLLCMCRALCCFSLTRDCHIVFQVVGHFTLKRATWASSCPSHYQHLWRLNMLNLHSLQWVGVRNAVVLTETFLITSKTKHHFTCLLSILISSSLKDLPKFSVHFSIQLFIFLKNWFIAVLSVLWMLILCCLYLLQAYSSNGGFSLCLGLFLRMQVLHVNVMYQAFLHSYYNV